LTKFGKALRRLRKGRGLSQRDLAAQVKVSFTYISKLETGHLQDGQRFPSEELIANFAELLGDRADELMLAAGKIPVIIRRRILARPEAFLRLAKLSDKTLDRLLLQVEDQPAEST
jgi:transcriptional regulator with XRE-family HTH domain